MELFHLYHHRSPNLHGVAWQRTAAPEDMARLPVRMAAMFTCIDAETHTMAHEQEKAP